MTLVRHILRFCAAMLLSAFGTNMAFAVPISTSDITFFQTESTHIAQTDDVGFAARASPFAMGNITIAGTQFMGTGEVHALGGVETVGIVSAFVQSSIAPNRIDWPELSGSLKEELNSASDVLAGKGQINYGMGIFNREQTVSMGEAWVGQDCRVTSKGYYESTDGLRQFRPPTAKDSPFASTDMQANFEQRFGI